MSVTFDLRTVKVELHFEDVRPDVLLTDSQRVFCHLTTGFDPQRVCKLGHGPAMAAFGSVNVAASPAELRGWDFGFVQLVKASQLSSFFAGATPRAGSIGMQHHLMPFVPRDFMLDSDGTRQPFIRGNPFGTPSHTPPVIKETMGDHPTMCAPKILQNEATKLPNHLFHVIGEDVFITSFAAQDPAKNMQYFAHFQWTLRYDFRFRWVNGVIQLDVSGSSVTHGPAVMGPPTDASVQGLLKKPAGPFALDVLNSAHFLGSDSKAPTRTDNTTWFNNVPRNFFL